MEYKRKTVLTASGETERYLYFVTEGVQRVFYVGSDHPAEEKFKTLLKRSPHVLQLIPHKYLASYLGIDASTFSKLLATVRI